MRSDQSAAPKRWDAAQPEGTGSRSTSTPSILEPRAIIPRPAIAESARHPSRGREWATSMLARAASNAGWPEAERSLLVMALEWHRGGGRPSSPTRPDHVVVPGDPAAGGDRHDSDIRGHRRERRRRRLPGRRPPIALPEVAAAALAAVDRDGDGSISTPEAAQSDWVGGKNCNHCGATSAASRRRSRRYGARQSTTGQAATECTSSDRASSRSSTASARPGRRTPMARPSPRSRHVRPSVDGKNCNHGGAVSERGQRKDHTAERTAIAAIQGLTATGKGTGPQQAVSRA